MCECCCKGSRRRSRAFKIGDHVRTNAMHKRDVRSGSFEGTIVREGRGDDVVVVQSCHYHLSEEQINTHWLEHCCKGGDMCECCCNKRAFKKGDHVKTTDSYEDTLKFKAFHGVIEEEAGRYDKVVVVRHCCSSEKTHLDSAWLKHTCTEKNSVVSRIFSKHKCNCGSEADTVRDARYRYINTLPSELSKITEEYNKLSCIDKAKDYLKRK